MDEREGRSEDQVLIQQRDLHMILNEAMNVKPLRTPAGLRALAAATLVESVLALSGCGSHAASGSPAANIAGTWDCNGNVYTFTTTTWSGQGTPSQNLPFRIQGDYIFMATLAREEIPMLKTKDGVVYHNDEGVPGVGPWDSPCKKVQ